MSWQLTEGIVFGGTAGCDDTAIVRILVRVWLYDLFRLSWMSAIHSSHFLMSSTGLVSVGGRGSGGTRAS